MNNITIPIVRTAGQHAALWEEGGSGRQTGQARLLCGPRGERLRPFFTNRCGRLACGRHALLPVWPGSCLALAHHDDWGAAVQLYRVTAVEPETLTAELVARPPDCFRDVLEAALSKAHDYHCREARYVVRESKPVRRAG